MRALSHPHIVGYYGAVRVDGHLHILMECARARACPHARYPYTYSYTPDMCPVAPSRRC